MPPVPYDGIVNLGVTEHLPDYPGTLRKYRQLLKPGGRVYLDASATRVSHDYSAFLLRHLFPGNGTTLCLHRYFEAVADSPFEVLRVHNDRESYRLTTLQWARNLDYHRDEIVKRWGTKDFRTFQLLPLGLRGRIRARPGAGVPLGTAAACAREEGTVLMPTMAHRASGVLTVATTGRDSL